MGYSLEAHSSEARLVQRSEPICFAPIEHLQLHDRWLLIREPKKGSNKWCLRRIRAHHDALIVFCSTDLVFARHTHNIYTSLDQLVRNPDQLVPAKKRIEGVHHGASVAHHDASRFTLDTISSIPFLFPRFKSHRGGNSNELGWLRTSLRWRLFSCMKLIL